MTPTNKLRFVEREVQVPAPKFGPNITKGVKIRKLQQWWDAEEGDHEAYVKAGGGWRDVPLEEEK